MRHYQVTDPSDGELLPRMYSYWANAWVDPSGPILVFAGHADLRPRFFRVDPGGAVTRLGSLVPYASTAEGWCWDRDGWILLCDGSSLRRVHPFTGDNHEVFDISAAHPGCRLWQAHSSDDGQTHSATVQRIVSDGPYPSIGTVVSQQGRQTFFPALGPLDESQVDPSGTFLVIKEGDDNRILTLATRETRYLRDADGAVGHSDCGDGLLIGEDNIHGACVLWDLRQPLTPERRRTLFPTWNMGYVAVRGDTILHSGDTHLSLVALDGSGLTPLLAHGGGSAYDDRVKANLSPCGRVATYMAQGIVWLLLLD